MMIKTQDINEALDTSKIIEIMEELGSPVYAKTKDGNGNDVLWFQTICHCGDSHKLAYYSSSNNFYCYTNCGSLSIYDLVGKVNHNDFKSSIKWLGSKLNLTNRSQDRNGFGEDLVYSQRFRKSVYDLEKQAELKNQISHVSDNKVIDNNILNYFDPNTFYDGWIDEGISIDSMQKYNIRWYELEKHIIIPHLNVDGQLVGIRRRSLKPEEARNKYMPESLYNQTYSHSLALELYGLYQNKEAIQKQKRVYLFEGEKSVLKMDSNYGNKSTAVATCGFSVSDKQILLLRKLGVETVYLCFDNDFPVQQDTEEYKLFCDKLSNICRKLRASFVTYCVLDRDGVLGEKDSPIDQGKDVFELLIKKAKRIKMD